MLYLLLVQDHLCLEIHTRLRGMTTILISMSFFPKPHNISSLFDISNYFGMQNYSRQCGLDLEIFGC